MSDVNSLEELIEWLKRENFDHPTTFVKLKEDEYDADIFCMATNEDLNNLDSTLKGGPKIKLRNLRDKLKEAKDGPAPQPTAGTKSQATPPPAPKPQPPPASAQPTATNTVPPRDERSGKKTPEYKAVINAYGDITRTLKLTPSANEVLSRKFIQESWIEPGVKCSNDDLLNSALGQIQQKASQFQVFLSMLRDMAGMDHVVKQLQDKVTPPCVQSVTPVTAVGVTPSATVPPQPLPPMNDPIFAAMPSLGELSLLEWSQNGQDQELRLIKMIAGKWKNLAIEGFGMKSYSLDIIEDKHDIENSCRNLFQAFLRSGTPKTGSPTWRGVVKALRKADLKVAAAELQAALPHK